MENTNINKNNNEDEKKQKNLEARRRAARAFHERNKDNEVYNKNKEIILKKYIKETKKEL